MDWAERGVALVAEWRHLKATMAALSISDRRGWIMELHTHLLDRSESPHPPPPPIRSVDSDGARGANKGRDVFAVRALVRIVASFCDAKTVLLLFSTTRSVYDVEWPLLQRDTRIWSRLCFLEFGDHLDSLVGGVFLRSGPWTHFFSCMPVRPLSKFTRPIGAHPRDRRFDLLPKTLVRDIGFVDPLPGLQFADYLDMHRLFQPALARSMKRAPQLYDGARGANRFALRFFLILTALEHGVMCVAISSCVARRVRLELPFDFWPVVSWLVVFVVNRIAVPCTLRSRVLVAIDMWEPLRIGSQILLPTGRWPPSRDRSIEIREVYDVVDDFVVRPTMVMSLLWFAGVTLAAVSTIAAFLWHPYAIWLAVLFAASSGTAKYSPYFHEVVFGDEDATPKGCAVLFTLLVLFATPAALWVLVVAPSWVPLALLSGCVSVVSTFVLVVTLKELYWETEWSSIVLSFAACAMALATFAATVIHGGPAWTMIYYGMSFFVGIYVRDAVRECVHTWRLIH